ncbi:MAG: hypothetical protein R3F37_07480 [Candidatus Competibacteraceae bacterium]
MKKTEQLCLGAWRKALIAGTHGDVLEVGAGTGVNLSTTRTLLSRWC